MESWFAEILMLQQWCSRSAFCMELQKEPLTEELKSYWYDIPWSEAYSLVI